MDCERKMVIDGVKIEEFYWAGKLVVYVNNRLTEKSFDTCVLNEKEKQTFKEANE